MTKKQRQLKRRQARLRHQQIRKLKGNYMDKQIKNYGLNLEMEAKAVSKKDWVLLGRTVAEIELDDTVIKLDPNKIYDYLPIGELQKGKDDFMDCATRAPVNIAETIFNYALNNNLLHPENVRWMKQMGYIVIKDGIEKVEFSDRFIAVKSGTTDNGNSLKAPVDAIYQYGLIPKAMFHGTSEMYRSEYLNQTHITSGMENTGMEFKRRFPVQFYKVYKNQFEQCLPTSPVDVAGFAWPGPDNNGVYQNTGYSPNHAFMYFAIPKYKIFDNYIDHYDGDWIKRLAENYNLLSYGYWMTWHQKKLWNSPADGQTQSDATDNTINVQKNKWLTFWEMWFFIPKLFKRITGNYGRKNKR